MDKKLTGELKPIPGEYRQCVDCSTTYPEIGPVAMCNGHQIDKCPWCRPDSKPWVHGRGI